MPTTNGTKMHWDHITPTILQDGGSFPSNELWSIVDAALKIKQ